VPSIKIKETFRKSVRHPLRKLSKENWERYGRGRYRVESVFGLMKQKLSLGFRLSGKMWLRRWQLLVLSCGTSTCCGCFYFCPSSSSISKPKSIHLNIFGTASL
jgi:hypothetical protein